MININRNEIISFLQGTDFFANIAKSHLDKLAAQFEPIYIPSGQTLIKQGEIGDCLYLIISGRIRALKKSPTGEEYIAGESGRGELIGELSLLTQDPRAATNIAIRDSILLKLSKTEFDKFIHENPSQISPILKFAIKRILNTNKEPPENTTVIAISAAALQCPKFDAFTQLFVEQLSKLGKVLHLNSESLPHHLKRNEININEINYNHPRIIQWLNNQEGKYRFIIYQTDLTCSEWTNLCLRQADKILLIACSDQNGQLGPIEKQIFNQSSTFRKSVELVLLHNNSIILPKGTANWLQHRSVDFHHHVKIESIDTIQRLSRYVAGKSISLVCGGGGARGLGYIGLYKALRELNIPIDMVSGTSAGAMIACFLGYGYTPEDIVQFFKKGLLANKKFFSYTLPFVSLISGKEWAIELKKCYGYDVQIEDLWKTFFCIATNMTTNKMDVLRRGEVWKAIRATISLPAVVPPMSNANDELLVDGGVINNLPADVMRPMTNRGKIIVARLPVDTTIKAKIPEGYISGWDLFLQRLNPFMKTKTQLPSIAEIISNTIMVSSQSHENKIISQADYTIDLNMTNYALLDFKPIDKIVEEGYRQGMEQLSEMDFEL